MIVTFLLILITGILAVIQFCFSIFNFIIPQQIPNAFNLFFSYVRIGDGLFPFLGDAMLAILTILTVWVLLYVIKLILFAFSIVPWIGKVVNLPNHKTNVVEENGATYTIDKNGDETVQKFSTRKRYRYEK